MLVFTGRKATKLFFSRHDCDCSFAAWLLRCQNTVNTSFKLNWGTTWSRLCVSTALWISAGLGADLQACFSLPVHSLRSCCFTCSELEQQPLLHMCRSDQIPAVFFFGSVTRWSPDCTPPHTRPHASLLHGPDQAAACLIFIFLISLFLHSPPLALLLALPKMKPPTPPLPFR